jgi:hypothetical protein
MLVLKHSCAGCRVKTLTVASHSGWTQYMQVKCKANTAPEPVRGNANPVGVSATHLTECCCIRCLCSFSCPPALRLCNTLQAGTHQDTAQHDVAAENAHRTTSGHTT